MIDSELIECRVGEPHITPEQIGDVNIGTYGAEDYVLSTGKQLAAELITNNSVRIFDGVMVYGGLRDSIAANKYYDISIDNGSQGKNRNDIIVRRYTKDDDSIGKATSAFAIVKGIATDGEAMDPEIEATDIRGGALEHNMLLYRIRLEGLNIVAVEPLFKTLMSTADLQEKLTNIQESISGLNGKVPQCIFVGTKAFTVSAKDYVELFTVNKLKELTGIDDLSRKNTTVIATNGDGASASDIHPVSVDYWGNNYNAWYAYFNKSFTGSVRIDCAVFYTPDKEMVNW